MSKEEIIKPKSHKKTPYVIKHDTPIIIQLPKYNVFLSIKIVVTDVKIGLDEYGKVLMNEKPNSEGNFEPKYYGINSRPVISLMTQEEVRDHLSVYQHD